MTQSLTGAELWAIPAGFLLGNLARLVATVGMARFAAPAGVKHSEPGFDRALWNGLLNASPLSPAFNGGYLLRRSLGAPARGAGFKIWLTLGTLLGLADAHRPRRRPGASDGRASRHARGAAPLRSGGILLTAQGCSRARDRIASVMSGSCGTLAISSGSARPMPGRNLPATSLGGATSS